MLKQIEKLEIIRQQNKATLDNMGNMIALVGKWKDILADGFEKENFKAPYRKEAVASMEQAQAELSGILSELISAAKRIEGMKKHFDRLLIDEVLHGKDD